MFIGDTRDPAGACREVAGIGLSAAAVAQLNEDPVKAGVTNFRSNAPSTADDAPFDAMLITCADRARALLAAAQRFFAKRIAGLLPYRAAGVLNELLIRMPGRRLLSSNFELTATRIRTSP